MIVTLELPSGSVITEAYLSDRLNCSRTPLREALQRLAQEQLVRLVPRRGVFVPELSIIEFGHLVEAKIGLERFSAPLAAQRISDEELAELEVNLVKAEVAGKEGDISRWVELDLDFHHRIARATHNPFVAGTSARLYRINTRFVYHGLKHSGTEPALEDHRRILEALQRRDSVETERRVLRHLANATERMRAALWQPTAVESRRDQMPAFRLMTYPGY